MKIEETNTPGKIRIDCLRCSKMFEIDDFRQAEYCAKALEVYYERNRHCEWCIDALQEEAEAKARQAKIAELQATFPDRLQKSGLPELYTHDRTTGELFTVPPKREMAEFIYRNRQSNLLISGETGTGKSTSACFIAARLLMPGGRIKYYRLSQLLSEWREARRSDAPYAAENLTSRLLSYDVLLLDEVAGKAKISESGQELMFELVERICNGESKTRLWMLGNFYTGSIEEIFPDGEPIRRRLSENFKCMRFDSKGNCTDITGSVWNQNEV